jgi:RNA-binding protein YhbY
MISLFSTLVSEHIDFLNLSIWSSVCVRLNSDISRQIQNSRLIRIKFVSNSSSSLDGIVSYLPRQHGGNVHDRGGNTIISSSLYSDNPSYAAKNAADLTADSTFISKNALNKWLCYDFGDC